MHVYKCFVKLTTCIQSFTSYTTCDSLCKVLVSLFLYTKLSKFFMCNVYKTIHMMILKSAYQYLCCFKAI